MSPVDAYSRRVLVGFDQQSNVVLSDTAGRIYSMDEDAEGILLGLCRHYIPFETAGGPVFRSWGARYSAESPYYNNVYIS
ncbi:hypothetical protein BDV93DRAFT_465228 [Ceratobasidium sp. AG-I]|nr:hypothetical protein BDV93DRAFT_465228 [Ceratobasidium sp. AG-I]